MPGGFTPTGRWGSADPTDPRHYDPVREWRTLSRWLPVDGVVYEAFRSPITGELFIDRR